MTWWHVLVEALGPPTDDPIEFGASHLPALPGGNGGDDMLDDFLDALTPMHASVGGGIVRDLVSGRAASWTARVSIEAPDPLTAATAATEAICNAATNAGLPVWPLSHVEAMDENMMNIMLEEEAAQLTW